MTSVCLFGGAFDPPHRSHRRVLEAAIERLEPQRTLVVPCADHAFKGAPIAPAEHRLRMCELAFGDLPGVEVSRLEIDRPGVSYAIDTVRHLRAELGVDDPLWLLLGADNLGELHRWREVGSLLELAIPVTFPRHGFRIDDKALRDVDIRIKHKRAILANALDLPADGVSSTAVRAALQGGATPTELAPAVLEHIRAHDLYAHAAAE
ncbi:MAG: nicotinate (nicotinamide) nucleotide adenylyltransferase [Planctomycetes bacterium]|nr:nicotinate (nicotinamide) nucleotide adenylyltransferase [Planctomycetota bacterium]